MSFKRLKVGSLVSCKDEKDLKKTLKALSDAGFGAAQCAKYRIYITRLPSPEERKD